MKRAILIILLNVMAVPLYSQHFLKRDEINFLNELKLAKSDSLKIDLLLKLAEYHILSSYDHTSNYDTATLLINQAAYLNLKVKSKREDVYVLIIKSYYQRTAGKREDGKKIILTAISLLKNTLDNELLGQAYYELSNYYDYDFKVNTIRQRIAYIDTAISAFEKSGAVNELGNCYKVLADLDHLINEYAKAFSEIRKSLEYYKITHYRRLEGVYDLLGQLTYARGDYKQALDYQLIALRTANNNNDGGPQLCEIENNVALTFYKLNDALSALVHFKGALEIAKKEHDNETIYGLASHIVETYIKLSQPQEAVNFLKTIEKNYQIPVTDKMQTIAYMCKAYLNLYTVLKQYNTARYYCNQLINKAKVPGLDVFRLSGYYTEIIKYFISVKDYKEGLMYLNKNKELLGSMHDDLAQAFNYTLWFSLDTAQGNFRSAVYNLLKANLINDTILNASKITEIKQLEVQYESEKKENDIRLKDQRIKVLTQSDLLRQANLYRATFIRNATLVAIILLLSLAGILFNQYKLKKKTNTVITQRNGQLNVLLEEKEWLLKEIHHRVKNNLQIVISLLNTQSRYLDNKEAIEAIAQSRHRMYAMSLIHQKLYQSENTTLVNMCNYISELTKYLQASFDNGQSINFNLNIDQIELDIAEAIPIGFILNETITNAIKYAFEKKDNGCIYINMHLIKRNEILLEIADNGSGLPNNFDIAKSTSMGMRLITGLVNQVGGHFTIENKNGVNIRITFVTDTKLKSIKTEPGKGETAIAYE